MTRWNGNIPPFRHSIQRFRVGMIDGSSTISPRLGITALTVCIYRFGRFESVSILIYNTHLPAVSQYSSQTATGSRV